MSGRPLTTDDPRLTAYALGELDEADHAVLEHELAGSPELRAEVRRIRDVAGLMTLALATESQEAFVRDVKLPRAARPAAPGTLTRRSRGSLFLVPAVAAMLVAAFLTMQPVTSGPGKQLAVHFGRHGWGDTSVSDFSDMAFFEYQVNPESKSLEQAPRDWSAARFMKRNLDLNRSENGIQGLSEAKDAPAQLGDLQESLARQKRYRLDSKGLGEGEVQQQSEQSHEALGFNAPITGLGAMRGAEAKPPVAEGMSAAVKLSLDAVPRFEDEVVRKKESESRLSEIDSYHALSKSFSLQDGELPRSLNGQISPSVDGADFDVNGVLAGRDDAKPAQSWNFGTNAAGLTLLYAAIDQDAIVLTEASRNGKYSDLRAIFRSARDEQSYGRSYEYGRWDGREYHGQKGLPTGFWVYLAPDWYIWGRRGADVAR